MLHRRTMQTQAFTLLEMAIVIVIIALVMGGLAGIKTYTRNAELTNTMNEAKFFMTAFNQFQTQYGGPPGDFTNASNMWNEAKSANTSDSIDHNGDGNGLIRAHSTPASRLPKERYFAFQHMALAGFIPGKYSGAATGTASSVVLVTDIPSASAKGVGFIFDHPDEADGVVDNATVANATYIDGVYPNVIIVAGVNANSSTIPDQAFMTPKQALQLDEKYDDGRAGMGNITPAKDSSGCSDAGSVAAANAVYTVSSDAKACYFIIKMVGT